MTALQIHHRESGRDGLTLQEIASMMDLTRERVRQIEAKALVNLRRKLQAAQLTSSDLYGSGL
jgi:DNA-directed RNA polymerase sigma subunit (sigma70/sigma32)